MSGKKISKGLYAEILFCLLFLLFPRQIMAETFSFAGNSMESVMAEGREQIILTGSAELLSEDNWIFADVIELYGEDFIFAHCRGRVKVLNNKQGIELFADEIFYDRRKKVVRIKGNAVMADKKNEIIIKGGFIEHWEERNETIIQLGVRILKKDLVCRGEYARYLREEEQLELAGMPIIYWKGDEYKASKIYIDLKNDKIRLEGNIRGNVYKANGEEESGENGE
jgi:lipopolysaccharide export system protein LptA